MNKHQRKEDEQVKARTRAIDADLDEAELQLARRHRQKKRLVRDIWIASGMFIIFMPLNLQITMLLLTTFVSFMILDETE